MSELDLSSTKAAFNTFFKQEDGKVVKGEGDINNPVNKVLNKVSEVTDPTKSSGPKHFDESGREVQQIMTPEQAEEELKRDKTFDELLTEFKLQNSDIFAVIDCYLKKGYYEQKYVIGPFEFAFRSRKLFSIDDISDQLDELKYSSEEAVRQAALERRVATCLVYFKLGDSPAKIFQHETSEDDANVLKFMKKEVHSPIYSLMAKEIQRFDSKLVLSIRD